MGDDRDEHPDGGRKRTGRKLLVASLGVATVSFVACGKSKPLITDTATDRGPTVDAGVPNDGAADASEPTEGGTESPSTMGDDAGSVDAGVDRQFIGNIIP
jgi:hypothetical protein